jgi:acyl carrier protein
MVSVYERVRKIVAEQLDIDEGKITPEALLKDDLGADSLDLVEIVMALEDEFSSQGRELEIPDEELEGLKAVGDAVSYIQEKLGTM